MCFRFKTVPLILGMRKKSAHVTDPKKDPVIRGFFLFFLKKLFTYSNIYVSIHLFIKQQLCIYAKYYDMELTISLIFFFTWVFRIQCRAQIRKPCSINMISRSLIFTICKQIRQNTYSDFQERKRIACLIIKKEVCLLLHS